MARVAAAMNTERIELAAEPGYGDVTWVSAYDVDPFDVPVADKLGAARPSGAASCWPAPASTTWTRR